MSSGMARAGWVSFSWIATCTHSQRFTHTPRVTGHALEHTLLRIVDLPSGTSPSVCVCFTRVKSAALLSVLFFVCLFFLNLGSPTLSGSVERSSRTKSVEPNLEALNRRMMSCRVAATTKYSCFSRSSFPSKNCSIKEQHTTFKTRKRKQMYYLYF